MPIQGVRTTSSPTWFYPEVRELISVPIREGDHLFGWLLAINHTGAVDVTTTVQAASVPAEEFIWAADTLTSAQTGFTEAEVRDALAPFAEPSRPFDPEWVRYPRELIEKHIRYGGMAPSSSSVPGPPVRTSHG